MSIVHKIPYTTNCVYVCEPNLGETQIIPEVVVNENGGPEEYFGSPHINKWWKEERNMEGYILMRIAKWTNKHIFI
jgi:hypothetical protein